MEKRRARNALTAAVSQRTTDGIVPVVSRRLL